MSPDFVFEDKVSVVVPVHNEAGNIQPQLEEIFSALDGLHFEVIYVDDGSTDETLRRLLEARRRYDGRLRILRHESVLGQSTAIYSGVLAARHPWIVTLDGDGQNDPSDIRLLLDAARAAGLGRVLVVGQRVNRRDGAVRRISSRIANGVRRALLRDGIPDTGCGLKVLARDLFTELPYFDHMHRFLPALVLSRGGRILSVPVSHRPRRCGKSKYGLSNRLWAGVVDLLGVAWLMHRQRRPARATEVDNEL
ncbi:MAG: glycosyltransferase family 2 protein [Arenicellales bacterium]